MDARALERTGLFVRLEAAERICFWWPTPRL